MLNRPLVPVAVVFTLGIAAADTRCPGMLAAFALCVTLCIATLCKTMRSRITLIIFLLVFLAGLVRTVSLTSISNDDISRFVIRKPPVMVARVISEPETRDDECFYAVRAEKVLIAGVWRTCTGRVWVRQRTEKDKVPGYGDHLVMRIHLSHPSGARNPGDFSWRAYLARKGIYTQAYVDDLRDISRLTGSGRNVAVEIASDARDSIKKSINRLFPPLQASVIEGMTLGSYSVLPANLLEEFSETGTLHLLAASGLNCAVISGVIGLMLFLFRSPKRLRPLIIIAALIFYLMLVGAKASIIRATVMTILGLLGLCARRPTDLINLLFAAALVILFTDPFDLFDLGFQLSFASAFGIVAVLPPVNKLLQRKLLGKRPKSLAARTGRWLKWHSIEAASATFAATIMTAPITVKAFNQLSLVSLPANVSVALASTPVLILGLISPLAEHVPGLHSLVSFCGATASGLVISAVSFFGSIPGNCIYVPAPNIALIAAYYLLVGALFRYVSKTASKT